MKNIDNFISLLACLLAILLYKNYQELKQAYKEMNLILNKTVIVNQSLMIFNQVPKTGSENMMQLINSLSMRNNFSDFNSNPEFTNQFGSYQRFEEYQKLYYIDMFQFYALHNLSKCVRGVVPGKTACNTCAQPRVAQPC